MHLLRTWEHIGWERERARPLNIGGAGTLPGAGAVEILDSVFHLSGLPWGSPGIFDDESEEDKKQDSTHVWSQTPNRTGAIGPSSLCGQTDVPGAWGRGRGLGLWDRRQEGWGGVGADPGNQYKGPVLAQPEGLVPGARASPEAPL